jgi:peptidyl-prolyl cis-trans isomerase B (cyclophilin B)
MRRLSTTLLAACALALGACGDDQANVGEDAGTDTAAQTEPTTTPDAQQTASGCEPVDEPQPKDVEDRKRPKMTIDEDKAYTAVVETNCGTLTIRLAAGRAPKTVNSFVSLARDDFYDGLPFHRIVPDFVAQGGDPAGTGQGGPGYSVVEAPPEDLRYTRGTVAMAKTELDEPGTSGSQFFIVTAEDAGLPPQYALLGKVEGSRETLDRIAQAPNDPADNRPTEPVVIEDITIRES